MLVREEQRRRQTVSARQQADVGVRGRVLEHFGKLLDCADCDPVTQRGESQRERENWNDKRTHLAPPVQTESRAAAPHAPPRGGTTFFSASGQHRPRAGLPAAFWREL